MRLTYEQAVDYLYNIPKFSKKTTMENSRKLLAALGYPERGQKFIHVAGTNGKGSTCAFIAQILKESGKSVGMFTSPHLVKINERFRVDGEDIDDDTFMWSFHQVYELCRKEDTGLVHPSYFEFLFLMGLLIFQRRHVEYTVLEVGLGGRLDATNVIETPLVSIIASISLDHTEILGETIEQIASEKAGIIKPGVPVVYNADNQKAADVIAERARQLDSSTYPVDSTMFQVDSCDNEGVTFTFREGGRISGTYCVPFPAEYQAVNAALALTAVRLIFPEIGLSLMRQAVGHAAWGGRMEQILPGVYLDGAHNSDGIRAFLETAGRLACPGNKYLLFSAVMEKDYETMIGELCAGSDFEAIILTEIDSYRALKLDVLTEAFARHTDKPVTGIADNRRALETALSLKRDKDILFIAGSLYLAGSIKEILSDRN